MLLWEKGRYIENKDWSAFAFLYGKLAYSFEDLLISVLKIQYQASSRVLSKLSTIYVKVVW